MAKIIIIQENLELVDDFSNNFKLTYRLIENKNKYNVEVIKRENKQGITIQEVFHSNNISSYNEASNIINTFIKNKVTPIAINDILDDLRYS